MPSERERELYNIVTIKNVDDEDFQFSVDSQPYLLEAGEKRNFPKFMATLAVKHLIDKILEKQDHEGKLMANQAKRDELASRIVVNEELFARPAAPTDEEIIEQMNVPSDLDNALEKNKKRLAGQEGLIPPPQPDLSSVQTPAPPQAEKVKPARPAVKTKPKAAPVKKTAAPPEKFDGLKLPSREEMLSHAASVLKLNVDDPKTKASFEKMSDQELYQELQMNNA